jgi:hypothetical protein
VTSKVVDTSAAVDPLKPRPKAFSKSTTAAPPTAAERTLWTETPKERQQRLQDEMMGKKRKAEISAAGADEEEEEENAAKRRREREIRRGIEGYNVRSVCVSTRMLIWDDRQRTDRILCLIVIRVRRMPNQKIQTQRHQPSGTAIAIWVSLVHSSVIRTARRRSSM